MQIHRRKDSKKRFYKYQYETLPTAFRLNMPQITLPRKQILSIGLIKLVCELDSVVITGKIFFLKINATTGFISAL